MIRTERKRRNAKTKKSFTLSAESVDFLESLRKKHRARSVSSVLERILESVRRAQKEEMVERSVADYYDALDAEGAGEQARWGEFALREFPAGRG
ncbi:MAG TPA: hypothetical protein VLX58_11335 [Bryobacteraceae bacterium]|nr:hypothetical protein [Bryobacteraceae bacterium]